MHLPFETEMLQRDIPLPLSVVRMVSLLHGRISVQQQPSSHNAGSLTAVPPMAYYRLDEFG